MFCGLTAQERFLYDFKFYNFRFTANTHDKDHLFTLRLAGIQRSLRWSVGPV